MWLRCIFEATHPPSLPPHDFPSTQLSSETDIYIYFCSTLVNGARLRPPGGDEFFQAVGKKVFPSSSGTQSSLFAISLPTLTPARFFPPPLFTGYSPSDPRLPINVESVLLSSHHLSLRDDFFAPLHLWPSGVPPWVITSLVTCSS